MFLVGYFGLKRITDCPNVLLALCAAIGATGIKSPQCQGEGSATVPARYGRVRMPVSCLVRFCNVSKGRPIPLLATPGRALAENSPPFGRPKSLQNVPRRPRARLEGFQDGSRGPRRRPRGFQDCQRWLKRRPTLSKMAQEASKLAQETPKTPPYQPRKAAITEKTIVFQ